MTPSWQERHCSTSSSSSSSSPTATSSDNETREREDRTESDSSPVPVSSAHVEEMIERWNPLFAADSGVRSQTNQNPKTNKEETTIERRNPLFSDSGRASSEIREWLQENREHFVDDEVPERRDSHASSSHEVSLEPIFKRREDLGKHCVYTHFPEDRNFEICQRTKITRATVQKTYWQSRTSCRNFWWLDNSRSQSSQWKCESRNNHRYAISVQIWPPNESSRIRAKHKLHRKHKEACKSSWSQIGNLKSFTLKISWNLSKPVKIFPGIIVRQHHTDQKQMGLLREQCAEWKKAPLLCCCNQVWMKVGGQIPWNGTPICETSQISYLMGRRSMKDVLGNHLTDRLFHLVHWLSIILLLRRTSQESINLERKSYLVCSLDMVCTRVEFGRVTYWLQTLRSWKRWTHRKSTLKDSIRKRWYFPKKKENWFFQTQMDESNPLEEIKTWERPPWYGIDQFKEKVTSVFLENQKGLFHYLKTHFRMPVKR